MAFKMAAAAAYREMRSKKTVDYRKIERDEQVQMVGVKPYPEIYRKMIDESGILPAESLFIDDSEANIRTAASLGFNTYLAAQHEDFRDLFSQYEPFTEK